MTEERQKILTEAIQRGGTSLRWYFDKKLAPTVLKGDDARDLEVLAALLDPDVMKVLVAGHEIASVCFFAKNLIACRV